MSRFRKVDPRIHNDEKFAPLDPLDKLLFLTLLTHPNLTPMGAGVFTPAVQEEIAGNRWGWCFRCQGPCSKGSAEHSAERSTERLSELDLVLRDGNLLIVRNFLVYNRPENPNTLVSWISACEELPRSDAFDRLQDHLGRALADDPTWPWLRDCLVEPLARHEHRGLKEKFWQRYQTATGQGKPCADHLHANRKVLSNLGLNVLPNQEQQQERERRITEDPPVSPSPAPSAQGSEASPLGGEGTSQEQPTKISPRGHLWRAGASLIGDKNGSFLGSLKRQYGDDRLMRAIGILAAANPPPEDPKGFLVACLKNGGKKLADLDRPELRLFDPNEMEAPVVKAK